MDARADVWSFGAVLYEMLTGEKAFTGESVSDILASVLKADPDWSRLPANTPPAIRKLLRRCLTKDRKQRLQAIGEARIVMEEAGEEAIGGKPEEMHRARAKTAEPRLGARRADDRYRGRRAMDVAPSESARAARRRPTHCHRSSD